MVPPLLRVNAVTRANRDETISRVRSCIEAAGAWVLDVKLFSNISVCFTLEVPLEHTRRFREGLGALDLHLTRESRESLAAICESSDSENRDSKAPGLVGTLQIVFIQNEPDLKIEVPRIPG